MQRLRLEGAAESRGTTVCRPFRTVPDKNLTQAKAWAIVFMALQAADVPNPYFRSNSASSFS
jgi:hypothetical protein